jgi:hypothetical protein
MDIFLLTCAAASDASAPPVKSLRERYIVSIRIAKELAAPCLFVVKYLTWI